MYEAFILMQDMHLNNRKENRFHYDLECLAVIEEIRKLSVHYRDRGFDAVNGISIGDLVDINKPKRKEYVLVQQQLKLLLSCFDKCFLNFGNHEFTYHKDNPVYSFIQEVQHPHIRSLYAHLVCESSINNILTPERLEFDNLEVVFRGWGTHSTKATDKHGILLLHAPLLSQQGLEELYANDQFEEQPYSGDLSGFDEVYCGHVHTITETWNRGGITVHNLGSLMRTKASEVSNMNRVRTLPVFVIKDNAYIGTEFHEITLHERSLIVDEDSVTRKQENYQEIKFRKQVQSKAAVPSLTVNDPLDTSIEVIKSMNDESLMLTLNALLERKIP